MNFKKISFPTAYTATFIAIIIAAAATWIIPSGSYNYKVEGKQTIILAKDVSSYSGGGRILPVPGTYTRLPGEHQGVFDVLTAPITGFYKAVGIGLFVIVIGGFLGIVMKTGALEASINWLIIRLKGRENLMIVVLMSVLAVGGTTFSMGEETLAFYPLLIPIMMKAGYDSFVCLLILVLGTQTGCLAALVSPFSVGIASKFIETEIGNGIGLRLIILLVVLAINIAITLRYASRIRKNPGESLVLEKKEELEKQYMGKNETQAIQQIGPKRILVIILFLVTFVIYTYGVIPFDSLGIKALPTLGWDFPQMTTLFATSGFIIGIIYGMNEKEMISSFLIGAADLLGVALIVGIARGITVVMHDGLILDTILNYSDHIISQYTHVVCLNLVFIVHIILSFFIPSTSGLAAISMPIMGPLATFNHIPKDLIVTAYMAASGIVNFFTPTGAIIMGGIIMSKASYGKFLKFYMPKLLVITIVVMILLSIGLYL